MGNRRVKQQNISVIGLFTLAGRHEKMDDIFVYHECQSTRWSHSTKNKKNDCHVPFAMFVRFFVFSYAFPIRFFYLFVFSCAFPIRFA